VIEVAAFANQPVAVLGLARSGLTSAVALKAGGAEVLAWDDFEAGRTAAAAKGLALTELQGRDWTKIAALVLSPGIPHTFPKPHPVAAQAIAAGCAIVCDIDLLARAVPEATYVGITGTNGKSTTTALVGHILKRAGRTAEIGGNIGVPVLDLVRLGADGTYVLELSSYQLERIPSVALDVAVLLNITPDHLDRHGSMAGYIAAKRQIFEQTAAQATAILSLDDPNSRGMVMELMIANRHRIVPVSVSARAAGGVFVDGHMLIDDMDREARRALDLAALPTLMGRHNWQNACAAYAVGRALGIESDVIAAAMKDFPGLAHRQEKIRDIGRVAYVNDSKATNTDSAAQALATYERIYWLAGGIFKEESLGALIPLLARVREAFLFGESTPKFAAWLKGQVLVTECANMEDALKRAHETAQKAPDGGIVLLSPACASFDQFRDFEHRGDEFRKAVEALPAREAA
jgi:UDP-N-acetylmuramoylalanine--D-glutamate ligase